MKIGTSHDLLKVFPFLENQDGWAKFAKAFDDPQCRENRRNAARSHRGPRQSKSAREMELHCFFILHRQILSQFSDIDEHGNECDPSPAQDQIRFDENAIALAQKVKILMSPTDEGESARTALNREIERLNRGSSQRNIVDAGTALFAFIRRESKLPTKRELNVEANRIARKEGGCPGRYPHGTIVKRAGWKSKMDNYYVYSSDLARCGDGEKIDWLSEIVYRKFWNEGRWDDSDFSKSVLKLSGFSGLPKSARS